MHKVLNSKFFHKKNETKFEEPKTMKLPKRVDRVILRIAYALISISLVMIVSSSYTATKVYSFSSYYFVVKHIVFCALTLFLMRFFSTKLHWLDKFGYILWLISIAGLIAVFFFGNSINGAKRWISLFGISLQPSEFAKIAVILQGAKYMTKQVDKQAFLITYLIPIVLILLQPDLGNTILIVALGAAQFIAKNFNLKYISLSILSFFALIILAYFLLDHVSMRINSFFMAQADIFGSGYQNYKSFLAMKNGGLLGKGFGKGVVKDFLPDAHTDFVFSVIVEEFGILGGMIVILLFVSLGYRVSKLLAVDEYIQLVQYSIIIFILAQAWLNIASTLSLIPTKGLTLPLVSYGGSGMLMQGITFGILLMTTRSATTFQNNV